MLPSGQCLAELSNYPLFMTSASILLYNFSIFVLETYVLRSVFCMGQKEGEILFKVIESMNRMEPLDTVLYVKL